MNDDDDDDDGDDDKEAISMCICVFVYFCTQEHHIDWIIEQQQSIMTNNVIIDEHKFA